MCSSYGVSVALEISCAIICIPLFDKLRKMCNKGEDDKMPPLKKKQHEIMRKFQNEKV